MTKTHYRLGALLILAAILLHNLTSPDRYKIVSTQGNSTVMSILIDGVTGETEYLFRTQRRSVEPAGLFDDLIPK